MAVCAHASKEDVCVPTHVLQGRLWVADTLSHVVGLLRADSRWQLVDSEANIGVNKLAAAYAGIKVLAVVASWETMRRLARGEVRLNGKLDEQRDSAL